MSKKLIDYFPEEFTPREQQIQVLKEIEKEIEKGTKYIVLNAPTGFGKSALSKTLSNYSEKPSDDYVQWINTYEAFQMDSYLEYPAFGCTALTITKSLQDQYWRDFPDGEVLKGKSNYQCMYDQDYDVEDAPCVSSPKLKIECWGCNRCLYYNQRNTTLTNKFQILNYSMFLRLPDVVKKRQFMILDEASELEDEIVKNFSLNINFEKLSKLGVDVEKITEDSQKSKVYGWLMDLLEEIGFVVAEIRPKLANKNSKQFKQNVVKYKILTRLHRNVEDIISVFSTSEYIVEETEDGDSITLTPLYIDKLTPAIFDHAKHILLMSATIIDPVHFCKTLGIKKHEMRYIEAKSVFDPKKSPIKCVNKYPLTYKVIDQNLPHVVDIVKQICDEYHPTDKGIIHTNSFKISKAVKEKMYDRRYLYREDAMKNEDLIEIHKKSKDSTVLVSPSMTHGVDLKGDLGKFQILMKIPYLPINNKRIRILSKRDFNWYANKMLSTLVQACGRCTRNETDEVDTYIVDGSIKDVLTRNKKKLPKYFLDRFV
jgi:ATP-dependent DNA helicase DinG